MWSLGDFAESLRGFDPGAGLAPIEGVEAKIRVVRGVPDFEDDVSVLQVRFE